MALSNGRSSSQLSFLGIPVEYYVPHYADRYQVHLALPPRVQSAEYGPMADTGIHLEFRRNWRGQLDCEEHLAELLYANQAPPPPRSRSARLQAAKNTLTSYV